MSERPRRLNDEACGRHRWRWPYWCSRVVFHGGQCEVTMRFVRPLPSLYPYDE